MEKKLLPDTFLKYQDLFVRMKRVLKQERKDKNKLYSLHEPDVACIAKGKASRPFEFGSKVSMAITKDSNIIVGVVSFEGNPHDNTTVEATIKQVEKMTDQKPKLAIGDRGYRGTKEMEGTQMVIPDNGVGKTKAEKAKARKRFRRRAAIEPIFGHLKNHYGLDRNYLKGKRGDITNALMAAAAFNFKSWLNAIAKFIFSLINTYIYPTNTQIFKLYRTDFNPKSTYYEVKLN